MVPCPGGFEINCYYLLLCRFSFLPFLKQNREVTLICDTPSVAIAVVCVKEFRYWTKTQFLMRHLAHTFDTAGSASSGMTFKVTFFKVKIYNIQKTDQ